MKYEAAAPGKINLGLRVLRRRPDGFHDVETVLVRIPWADHLSIEPADEITLSCTDPSLPVHDENLCVRAARALAEAYAQDQGAHIHLVKRLPWGAGLGGGSSDAATTLRLLVDVWRLPLEPDRLAQIASGIGSDVLFFLGPAAALAEGRGERLTPLVASSGDPYTFPFPLVIAVPPIAVSTAEAYSEVRPLERTGPNLAEIVRSNDLARWQAELSNDFESSVFVRHPTILALKRMLLGAGAGYTSLSGSGSAVFGVFADEGRARAAAEAAEASGCRTWWGMT